MFILAEKQSFPDTLNVFTCQEINLDSSVYPWKRLSDEVIHAYAEVQLSLCKGSIRTRHVASSTKNASDLAIRNGERGC